MNARSKFLVKLLSMFAFSIGFGILLGPYVSFEIQKTLATTLSGISSILFGVLGIWIGLLAPENLKSIYTSNRRDDKMKSWKDLESLYKPVFLSLFIFSFSTALSFTGEIIKTISICNKFKIEFRIIGMFLLMNILVLTIYLLFLSIKPGIEILANSFTFISRSENMKSFFPDKK